MATFQLLGCQINVGGNRDTVVWRSRHSQPVTYAELVVLQYIHGGEEHVHHVMIVGEVERDQQEEYERLLALYGEPTVKAVFPNALAPLPLGNESFPSEEEVIAGEQAAKQARAKARAAKKPKRGVELPAHADDTQELPA